MEYTRQVIDLFKMTRHGSDRMDDFNDAESKEEYLFSRTHSRQCDKLRDRAQRRETSAEQHGIGVKPAQDHQGNNKEDDKFGADADGGEGRRKRR